MGVSLDRGAQNQGFVFFKTNTYEIECGSNFEGFSKVKIVFEGVGRARKGAK